MENLKQYIVNYPIDRMHLFFNIYMIIFLAGISTTFLYIIIELSSQHIEITPENEKEQKY